MWRTDEFKLNLQLVMDVKAFTHIVKGSAAGGKAGPRFDAFEQADNLAPDIGKQCRGWQQQVAKPTRAHAGTAGLQPGPSAQAHPASPSADSAPALPGQGSRP